MRKLIAIALMTCFVAFAQTVTAPLRVDWRYTFQWDDPNPVGTITNWVVVVSNLSGTTNRLYQTKALSCDHISLLGGLPAGVYPLVVLGQSASGAPVEPSTNHVVEWPGGNGKLKGAQNLRSGK